MSFLASSMMDLFSLSPTHHQSLDDGLVSRTTAFLAKLCFLLNIKGGDYNRLLSRTTKRLREWLGVLLALSPSLSINFFIPSPQS